MKRNRWIKGSAIVFFSRATSYQLLLLGMIMISCPSSLLTTTEDHHLLMTMFLLLGRLLRVPVLTMAFLTSLVIAMALYVLLSNPVPSHQLSQLSGSSLKLVSIICKVQIWRGRGLLLFALVMIPNPVVANPSHALEFSILPNANLLLSASKNPPWVQIPGENSIMYTFFCNSDVFSSIIWIKVSLPSFRWHEWWGFQKDPVANFFLWC